MATAVGGLWVELSDPTVGAVALVAKLVTPSAKALVQGARTWFVLGHLWRESCSVLCIALELADQDGPPLLVMHALSTEEEHHALAQFLRLGRARLFVFDELERCVAWSTVSLCQADDAQSGLLAGRLPAITPGVPRTARESALDAFGDLRDTPSTTGPVPQDCRQSLELFFGEWTINNIIGIGSGSFGLTSDEGSGLEQAAHQLLESLFEGSAYRSPYLQTGSGQRELADSLAVYEGAFIVLQSKALGMVGRPVPTPSKKADRIAKDVRTGLKQAKGAVRKLRERAQLVSNPKRMSGMPIPHGTPITITHEVVVSISLILVSDLEVDAPWEQITRDLLEASSSGDLYMVVDLTELRALIGAATGPMQFVTNCIIRFSQVRKVGATNIRVRISRSPG